MQDRLFSDPLYAAALGATPKDRQETVLKGGLKIYATLDQTAQANAQNAMNEILPEKPVSRLRSSRWTRTTAS